MKVNVIIINSNLWKDIFKLEIFILVSSINEDIITGQLLLRDSSYHS